MQRLSNALGDRPFFQNVCYLAKDFIYGFAVQFQNLRRMRQRRINCRISQKSFFQHENCIKCLQLHRMFRKCEVGKACDLIFHMDRKTVGLP